ncbi:hypothetical protein P3342_010734 [Pyrenophora teres f. teres]|nr:hypothetical protein P3342_010734 [Pyrenophora teres f. teres]
MASVTSAIATWTLTTSTVADATSTAPSQGSLEFAGVGITGGYTGSSLPLQIIIAFFLGLSLYNAIELIVLALVTFQRYQGLYFWSLLVSAGGIIPYSLGFIIKFFRLLDPAQKEGYVAIVLLTVGWWGMVSGQSVVLWTRLHLVTSSRRVLRYTLYMIIIDGIMLHSITTVLTFGSNSKALSSPTLRRFVRGYSIMEKTQMVGFFLQETILSVIYIKETLRLLQLSASVQPQNDTVSLDNINTSETNNTHLKSANVRRTMYQLLAINILIITMDLALLATEFANLYIIETTLKGVVYSIKLKLEFAVLEKLVQLVRDRAESDFSVNNNNHNNRNGRRLEKADIDRVASAGMLNRGRSVFGVQDFGESRDPDFEDASTFSASAGWVDGGVCGMAEGWETRGGDEKEGWRRRGRGKQNRNSWIEKEMDRHGIV